MLFNSVEFLIFLPVVLIVFFVLPQKIRNYWLLLASYYFYMCWDVEFGFLILISTVITYLAGLGIQKWNDRMSEERPWKMGVKRGILALSFLSNLGILFYFKYFNFTAELLNIFFLKTGISITIPAYDIILPVGISFYTFQALGYTMDVYRKEIRAEKNFFTYALFVSFFPQLVAGPIERSENLLSQLKAPARFSYESFQKGLLLMLWGFFLKIVLADRIAIFVDTVYGNLSHYTGWFVILATAFFGIQIYCDFYGYSIIAKGAALMLNIELMENFQAPYLSTSVAMFWRNWHISLTSWFKDYLYFPLGGSRKGRPRKYVNKMIVFLVSGLWHGANLTFVFWGGLNGLYQVVGEMLLPIRRKIRALLGMEENSLSLKLLQMGITYLCISFSWVFFRAHSMQEARMVLESMFSENNIWIFFDGTLSGCGLNHKNMVLVLNCIALLFVADLLKKRGIFLHEKILSLVAWIRIPVIVFCICFLLIFGIWGPGYAGANFIYFQF